ncbi:helix-turn-helix transcriptional regulator [Rhodococcus fascians]|nr:helix-turn-helix transcriptional regulator [Rhodococcus fascians]
MSKGGGRVAASGRSACPVNLSLEVLGDRWSLLILRDIMFRDRRQFREMLRKSEENIASNVLTNRLQRLVEAKILTRAAHPGHKQKIVYTLTDRGVQLLPMLIQLGAWGADDERSLDSNALWFKIAAQEGPATWRQMMTEVAARHSTREAAAPTDEPAFSAVAAKVEASMAQTH